MQTAGTRPEPVLHHPCMYTPPPPHFSQHSLREAFSSSQAIPLLTSALQGGTASSAPPAWLPPLAGNRKLRAAPPRLPNNTTTTPTGERRKKNFTSRPHGNLTVHPRLFLSPSQKGAGIGYPWILYYRSVFGHIGVLYVRDRGLSLLPGLGERRYSRNDLLLDLIEVPAVRKAGY